LPPIARVPSDRDAAIRLAVVVAFVALVVRLVYLVEFQSSVFFSVPILDAAWHAGWAHRIAGGHLLDGAPYFRAPLYTWFLAAIEAMAGSNPWWPRLVQAVLGALAAAFVALAAERISPRAGLPAGPCGARSDTTAGHDVLPDLDLKSVIDAGGVEKSA